MVKIKRRAGISGDVKMEYGIWVSEVNGTRSGLANTRADGAVGNKRSRIRGDGSRIVAKWVGKFTQNNRGGRKQGGKGDGGGRVGF